MKKFSFLAEDFGMNDSSVKMKYDHSKVGFLLLLTPNVLYALFFFILNITSPYSNSMAAIGFGFVIFLPFLIIVDLFLIGLLFFLFVQDVLDYERERKLKKQDMNSH